MLCQCIQTFKPNQHSSLSLHTSEQTRVPPSTITTLTQLLKPLKLCSKTTSSHLEIHIGNKSPVLEWVSLLHLHGQQSSMPSMNNNSSLNGQNMSYSTNVSLTTSLEFGYPTHAPNRMKFFGINSNNECKNGMACNGNSPPPPHHVPLWT